MIQRNPLILMTALAGYPTAEKVFQYLKNIKNAGIEQCLLYPRAGCSVEYLSEKWFEIVGWFIQTADKLHMGIWLYDEYNWPSGDANGRVTAVEQYRLKAIQTRGTEIGRISTKSQNNGSLFCEKYFPDLLSDEATDYFIQCTHEQYFKRFGKYFGTVIRGIFTDEPAIGYCCTENSIPYYEELAADYAELCGRDFFCDLRCASTSFYECAMQAIGARFGRCYIEKLSGWCKKHNVLMTGHLMCDDHPFRATKQSGNILKNLSSFMIPGIDEIATDFKNEYLFSLMGTAEYAAGNDGAMAELFALGPCDMSYAKKRCMIYLCACHKISHYFLAISHLNMIGNMEITDFFNNFMSDQPDFDGMKLLSDEAKNAAELSKTDFEPDVYIRYPTDICAKSIVSDLKCDGFISLINHLTYRQIQWKFVDEGDACPKDKLIDFTEDFHYLYNGREWEEVTALCKAVGKQLTVTDKNGKCPKNIFVRTFKNGSTLVLNLSDATGEYKLHGKGFWLDEYGVYFSEEPVPYFKHCQKADMIFNVQYDNLNMIRMMYVNDEKKAVLDCKVDTPMFFAVRNGVTADLNGKRLNVCTQNSPLISFGMKELYGVTEQIVLEKGRHVVESVNDYKYLPSVFVIGDFAAQLHSGAVCDVVLTARKKTYMPGELFCGYGAVTFEATVTVPEGAKGIELKGTMLYTCLYINDVLIDSKIHAPYVYTWDTDFHQTEAHLKIVQYSGMGPIFGDVVFWNEHSNSVCWNNTPAPGNTLFGFNALSWLF